MNTAVNDIRYPLSKSFSYIQIQKSTSCCNFNLFKKEKKKNENTRQTTNIAHVRLLARVYALVIMQGGKLFEPPVTLVACIRSFVTETKYTKITASIISINLI